MATTHDLIAKLQAQSLDTLKQAQAAHVAALETIREVVAEIPTSPAAAVESLPTITDVVELNSKFAKQLLDQQNAYATQLATIFTAAQKAAQKLVSAN